MSLLLSFSSANSQDTVRRLTREGCICRSLQRERERASSSSAAPLQRGTGAAGGVGDAELPGEGQSVARAVWDTGRKRDLGCRETGMGLGSPGAPVPVPCVVLERWRGRTGQQRFANRPLSGGTAGTVLGLPKGERALMLHLAGLRDPTASPKATGEHAQREANP